jgi:hypothetical protein
MRPGLQTFAFVSAALLLAGGVLLADLNPTNYVMEKEIKFFRSYVPQCPQNTQEVLRVNLDLSLNSGSNWHKRIATGIPAEWGTNSYIWSLRMTPDLWTEHARIGVRTLWASRTNKIIRFMGDMSDSDFSIMGVRFVSPVENELIYQPGYKTISWHEAGVSNVTFAIKGPTATNWTPLYTLASPNPTNSYSLPVANFPTGNVQFMIWAKDDLYHDITVRIRNR